MTFLTLIGTIGAALLLIAFLMNQLEKWHQDDLIYDLTNFTGALILVVYALLLEGWPFAILNGIWAAYSFRDLVSDTIRNSKKQTKNFYSKWLK